MTDRDMYHDGSRVLQDRFDTRRLADRLETVTVHQDLTEGDRRFIERSAMFFLATADASGRPDCSFKGGVPGFVRIIDDRTLAFPDYDGNGMFRSLGNIRVNPHVGLLFIDFAQPDRLRVNGVATIHDHDALLDEMPGAQLMVRVQIDRAFPNCPRYIPDPVSATASVYAPRSGHVPPEPDWKSYDAFRDALPERR